MFIAHNQVRMHDTDMAGILFFARQFRFAHDALEDFAASEGFQFNDVFQNRDFLFVIVHAEADYMVPLMVSDKLEVHLSIEQVGQSSFTAAYDIYKIEKKGLVLAGRAKTVHVTIDKKKRTKISIPDDLRKTLTKHREEAM